LEIHRRARHPVPHPRDVGLDAIDRRANPVELGFDFEGRELRDRLCLFRELLVASEGELQVAEHGVRVGEAPAHVRRLDLLRAHLAEARERVDQVQRARGGNTQ
jgi:hypothetical protein